MIYFLSKLDKRQVIKLIYGKRFCIFKTVKDCVQFILTKDIKRIEYDTKTKLGKVYVGEIGSDYYVEFEAEEKDLKGFMNLSKNEENN